MKTIAKLATITVLVTGLTACRFNEIQVESKVEELTPKANLLDNTTPNSGETATQIQLSWQAPTLNTDQSQLTDLSGYIIFFSIDNTSLDQSIDVGNVTQFSLPANQSGSYYVSIRAVNTSGGQSALGKTLTFTVP